MSTATPTLIPKLPLFPHVLPELPKPHPKPLAPRSGFYSRLNAVRNFNRELDELSEEERELEEMKTATTTRGFNYLVPIGRMLTQQEEKNDASADDDDTEDSSEESEDGESGSAPSDADPDGEEEDGDLDASMEDLDEDGDMDDLDE